MWTKMTNIRYGFTSRKADPSDARANFSSQHCHHLFAQSNIDPRPNNTIYGNLQKNRDMKKFVIWTNQGGGPNSFPQKFYSFIGLDEIVYETRQNLSCDQLS